MWLVGVLWACVVLCGVGVVGLRGVWWCVGVAGLWGVSIIREWGKYKANPPEKSKKKLTRVLKK